MHIAIRLVVSIVIALIASIIYNYINQAPAAGISGLFSLPLFATIAIATIATTLLVGGTASANNSAESPSRKVSDADREQGKVKWFNYSKGFGFITRDQGEDIFVHYRSIRGKGRRSLHEGQRVEFTVVDSEKGLQAEEVEAFDAE